MVVNILEQKNFMFKKRQDVIGFFYCSNTILPPNTQLGQMNAPFSFAPSTLQYERGMPGQILKCKLIIG